MVNDDGKMWYESKVVWLNVVLTLIGALTVISDYLSKAPTLALSVPGGLMVAIGILGVILRVWFTDQPVAKAFFKK